MRKKRDKRREIKISKTGEKIKNEGGKKKKRRKIKKETGGSEE